MHIRMHFIDRCVVAVRSALQKKKVSGSGVKICMLLSKKLIFRNYMMYVNK